MLVDYKEGTAKSRNVSIDCACLVTLFLAGFLLCWHGSGWINPAIRGPGLGDVWFDADPGRCYQAMLSRIGESGRTSVHPIGAILMFGPAFVLRRALGLTEPAAARATMSSVAGAWLGLLYFLFRVLGCRLADSLLLTALGATCSAAMFVFVVPEAHPIASITVALSLLFAAWSRGQKPSEGWYAALGVVSASMTATNWMYGALTTWFAKGWKRCLQITVNAFFVLTLLSVAQTLVFPGAGLFFSIRDETHFVNAPNPARVLRVTSMFLLGAVVMPELGATDVFSRSQPIGSEKWPFRALSVQRSWPGSGSVFGWIALGAWLALLLLGFWAWKRSPRDELTSMMPWALAAQLALHCVYGGETLLYALNWLPLLLVLAALAMQTKARPVALGLLTCLIAANAANNTAKLRQAADMLNHPGSYPILAGPVGRASPLRQRSGFEASPVQVLTSQYDIARTGANLRETALNVSNVNVERFGKLFARYVDGSIYAQPLFVSGVDIPGAGRRNVVYVATMHDSVYAFDADDPAANAPYWKASLGTPMPITGNTAPEIGILSTPVIDASTGTIYVAAVRRNGSLPALELHGLGLADGKEKFGGPVVVRATVRGQGYDSVEGVVRLKVDSHLQLQRTGLLLIDNAVILGLGGYQDADPYHGWLIAYRANNLREQIAAINTTPDASRGGIWQSGGAPAADSEGNLYVVTSNGEAGGLTSFGCSFLKLSAAQGLAVTDWYTPENCPALNDSDWDLGTSGPILITGTRLLVGGSKLGMIYVLNRDHLGHGGPAGERGVQRFQATPPCRGECKQFEDGSGVNRLAYWNRPSGPLLYVWGWNDVLSGYRLRGSVFDTTPATKGTVHADFPGGVMTVSADGGREGSGILWAATPSASSRYDKVAGTLRAFDASDVSHELWSSDQNYERDFLGAFAKFAQPTVVHGKVYAPTFSNRLVVYGLY